jgi:hypothetical protein
MEEFIALESLFLDGCIRLKHFPLGFRKLIRLKHLNMEDFKDIKWLSDVVEQLTTLKTLNVFQCSNLKSLPLGLGKWSS